LHFGGEKVKETLRIKRNEEICKLYFQSKMTFSDISKVVNISVSQISRIVAKNENYIYEKTKRIEETEIKHRESTKEIMRRKRNLQSKANKDEKAILDYLHNQASCELSKGKTINNRVFKKWNSSAYEYYAKTKEYRIKEEFKNKMSYAAPRKIKWD